MYYYITYYANHHHQWTNKLKVFQIYRDEQILRLSALLLFSFTLLPSLHASQVFVHIQSTKRKSKI